MGYFELHSITVSIVKVTASLLLLILPCIPQYFLYVLKDILSLLASFTSLQ